MAQTTRYALPFLQAGQAQKEITHNDALARIDSLLHLAVQSRHAAPATGVGTIAIVPANATADWAGHDGQVAVFDGSGWTFIVPLDGCIAFVRDEGLFIHYAAGQWRDAWAVPSLVVGALTLSGAAPATVADPALGAVIDVEARAAISQLLAALRNAGIVAHP